MKANQCVPGERYWFVYYGLLRCGYHQGILQRGPTGQPMQSFFAETEGRYYKLQDREAVATTEIDGLNLYIDYCTGEIYSAQKSIAGLLAGEQSTNQTNTEQ